MITRELIFGLQVTSDCRTFGHVRRPLPTAHKLSQDNLSLQFFVMQLKKVYKANTSCSQLLLIEFATYNAQDQFPSHHRHRYIPRGPRHLLVQPSIRLPNFGACTLCYIHYGCASCRDVCTSIHMYIYVRTYMYVPYCIVRMYCVLILVCMYVHMYLIAYSSCSARVIL